MSAQRERVFCWLLAILGVVAAGVLVLSFVYSPEEVARGAIQEVFGVTHSDCPGCALCGLSRAFSWASHGDWKAAHELNNLFLPAYGLTWLMALCGPAAAVRLFGSKRTSGNDT